MNKKINNLTWRDFKIDVYLDTANLKIIKNLVDDPAIKGITTNPMLLRETMSKGMAYEKYLEEIFSLGLKIPISLPLLDEKPELMLANAIGVRYFAKKKLSPFYIKVPVLNSHGQPNFEIIRNLYKEDFNINVTCIFTLDQLRGCRDLFESLSFEMDKKTQHIFSIFAGRLADIYTDPVWLINKASTSLGEKIKVLWASTREVINIRQAIEAGADIITISPEIYSKRKRVCEYSETQYCIETVKMFQEAADKIKWQ